MKITEILNNRKMSLSFEVFPPKTDTAFESVQQATREIAKLKPSYMSITYGAGGGTSKYTLDIAEDIMKDYGVPTLAHLTCVSSSKATVQDRIFEMNKRGIKNVLALRGDIPTEMEADDRSGWDHRYAVDLIREIKESGFDFCIGGACYPEIHPESSNQKEDIKHLKEKVDAGCEFLTTQMFFDNNIFYNFLYRAREAGIDVPIIPGIMPITRASQVENAVKLSGCNMPERFINIVDHFGGDKAAMQQAGIIYATDQIIDLIANGITNIHVYSMNNSKVAQGIQENLSEILKA